MSGALVYTKIDWASNPSYPWHGMSSLAANPGPTQQMGNASMQTRQWIVVFTVHATDGSSQLHEWLVWATATGDSSGNLTLAPLQWVDLTSYGNSLLAVGAPGTTTWTSSFCVQGALPGLQDPTVDVVLYVQNITAETDITATAIFDAFLPLNIDLTTSAVIAHSIATIDVFPFYFFRSFFFTSFWVPPEYTCHGNTKIMVISSVVTGSVGRVNAIAGTCSAAYSLSSNFFKNIGSPSNPVFIDPGGSQYLQMPFTSNDLLFSALTITASPVNIQNSLILPSTFPASFGSSRGDTGSTLFWNDPTFPFNIIHGGQFTGFVSNASNPGVWNQGASSFSVPSGVAPPPGGSSLPMMTQAPDNDIIPGQIAILGCTGGTSTNPGTSTEVYRLGQSGPDWSPSLISHISYPIINANFRTAINHGFSDVSGNPAWMFYDSSVGGGTNSDWFLWAGAFTQAGKWSIGSVLVG